MRKLGRTLIDAAAMVGMGVALAACGGGGEGTVLMRNQTAGQGIAVGEPNGGVPVVSEYIEMAREASCASTRNQLYVVDGKYVLWDRAGNCADNSYGQTLMGANPQAVLCTAGDTIAGPRTSCSDESVRALFDTMLKNLDKADLGLGAGHKVEPVGFLPKSGTPVAFKTIVSESFSNIATVREVVIKDAAAWSAVWAEHAGSEHAVPKVDFKEQMVLGVFRGPKPSTCHGVGVGSVSFQDGKLRVGVVDSVPAPGIACGMMIVYPAHLVIVKRSEAPVEFVTETRTNQ